MAKLLKQVVTYFDPHSPTSEAIRCLRTNTLFLATGKDTNIVGITSPAPQEGKSFLAVNLAVTAAQSGKKTFLIDADLRRSGVSKMLGLTGKKGLSSTLTSGEVSLEQLPLYDIGIENLTVFPAGPVPSNPAELLEKRATDDLLSVIKNACSVIYIDAPPILSVTDPIIVFKRVDGVILVAMANVTPRKAVLRTYSLLKDAGIHLMGTVLNKVDAGIGGYYRYKYRYRYYYSK